MRNLPEGHLTILFTDIEGSTELVKRLGPLFPEVLDHHNRLLRGAFNGHGGVEVRTMGDAFFYVFTDAAAALAAATEGQRVLYGHDWPHGEMLLVRMGLHSGEVTRFDEDYAGFEIHRAARIAGCGHGGQVIVSQTTMAEVGEALPPGVAIHDCGAHWLKDLSAPEPLVRAVADGLPDVDRPLSSLGRPPLRVELAAEEEEVETGPRGLSELSALLRQGVEGSSAEVRLRPSELATLAHAEPEDLDSLRLSRIAEWSQPRYQIDTRFVSLSLLLDKGEQVQGERWVAEPERHESLMDILAGDEHAALVVLGPPGSGKSTLLRYLELSLCSRALRDAAAQDGPDESPITFFVPLNSYRATELDGSIPPPLAWLEELWRRRYPQLPELASIMAAGRLVLLLDGLNEIPHANDAEYRRKVEAWRGALQDLLRRGRGNRAIFSCRSLDYSAPLSTPALRVPQVRVEAFDDRRVQQFLALYNPERATAIWRQIAGTPTLELLRTPYFLALLVEQVSESGEVPLGRASLFSGFVRQAMRRELERGQALFQDAELLHPRDSRRLTQARSWRKPWELPSRGALVPGLERLAYGMQVDAPASEGLQVRIAFDDALDLMEDGRDEDILRAGVALAVLDEDIDHDEVLFYHQLLQEYFAARRLAEAPDPDLVAKAWRTDAVDPPLANVVEALDPADRLPVLPSTGWEETSRLAAVMADDPAALVADLAERDLPLAGRCAAEPELAERLPEALVVDLRTQLASRAEDPAADLRARLAAARALGRLGDPRYEVVATEDGSAMVPPLIEIPAQTVRMGTPEEDTLGRPDERPPHDVSVEGFRIARFPVTNAEWQCFVDAGGYQDERWWGSDVARAWRLGEGVLEGQKHDWRSWRKRFVDDPEALETMATKGLMSAESIADWRRYTSMDEASFERTLDGLFPDTRESSPRFWAEAAYNHPAQAVVGICWYEALAYATWLSHLSGQAFRLPSEAEWASAARGADGRRFAWGEELDPLRGNVARTRLKAPSPVGVFPEGRTPEGVDDLSGNVFEWTTSRYGDADGQPEFGYPYRAEDGREEPVPTSALLRVTRGGSWADGEATARAAYRNPVHPALRHQAVGLRLVCGLGE
jgi:formylglycine-generating enzyme required for sulfatase activity/class 3 adenylate cyclase